MDKLNWYFVKIDPASGAITTSPLSFAPNIGLFSATIDPCSNRYIVSTEQLSGGSSTYKLLQLDMNGNVVQSNTTPTFYNGLTVN